MKGTRVRKVSFVGDGQDHPLIHVKVEDLPTREMIRNRMFEDAASLFQVIFQDYRASLATVYLMRKGRTIFGFTKLQDIMMITASRETTRHVDLNEYRSDALIDIAEYVYEVDGWE